MIIKKLSIFAGKLTEQIKFYRGTLGLSILERGERSVSFRIGQTIFEMIDSSQPYPYHFAINIPSNSEKGALAWLHDRVKILKDGDSELIDFKSWNSKSIYFYDADGNIVELIARKNLEIYVDKKFSHRQFLGISEIGMPVENIEKTYIQLKSIEDIEIYDGNFDHFCAIGDENGLFIVVDSHNKKWFPTQKEARPAPFRIEGEFNFEFQNGLIIIS